jgi:hypothetical protein
LGFDGTTDQFCAKAKKEGYDGIEMCGGPLRIKKMNYLQH